MTIRFLKSLSILILACLLAACGSSSPKTDPGGEAVVIGDDPVDEMTSLPDRPDNSAPQKRLAQVEYRIGDTDEIEVQVFMVEELSGAHVVDSRGEIRMPLLDGVRVAGLTVPEVEQLLEELLEAHYLQDPQVSVRLLSTASHAVTILGAVGRPGIYPLGANTTLLQVIALAGGTSRVANEEELVLFRGDADGTVYGYLVQLDVIMTGEKRDPVLQANDRIVVPESGISKFIRSFSVGIPGFGGNKTY